MTMLNERKQLLFWIPAALIPVALMVAVFIQVRRWERAKSNLGLTQVFDQSRVEDVLIASSGLSSKQS